MSNAPLSQAASQLPERETPAQITESPILSQEQRLLGEQAFETAVEPLRKGFQERLTTTTEQLGRRGIAFGGVGEQSYSDLLESELAQEAQLAGSIATSLGRSALEQAFAANEAAKARQFQAEQAQLGREFAGEQSEIGREFSEKEREDIQQFQTAFQEAGFDQQFSLIEQQQAEARQDQILQLFLSGNLTGEDAQTAVQEILGQPLVLTNADELALQRAASAAGLTVDEYKAVRSAVGTEQQRLILENPEEFIFDPEKAREFQEAMAWQAAEAQKDIAREQSGKVLCTELHRQGLLDREILEADLRETKNYCSEVRSGYLSWGIPLSKLMRNNKTLTYILKPFIKSWAYHMAYKQGVHKKFNLLGFTLELIGIPACFGIGFIKKLLQKNMEVKNYA